MKISISRAKQPNESPKSNDDNTVLGQKLPMTWRPQMLINGVHFDDEKGAAGNEDAQNPILDGFMAYMRVSSFMSLCQMRGTDSNDRTTKGFRHYLKNKGTIAIPILTYDVAEQEIVYHDGRHRCLAIMNTFGDIIIPIRFKLAKGIRGRIVNRDMLNDMNEYMQSENGQAVSGALLACVTQNEGFINLSK